MLPKAAVVCQARVLYSFENCYGVLNRPKPLPGNTMQLIIYEMMPFLNSFLMPDAVPFNLFVPPSPHYLLTLYYLYPPRIYFGAVYQFNQFAHREKEEGLAGREEGRREATQSASSPHPHSNASLLGSHLQPRRQVSAITVN